VTVVGAFLLMAATPGFARPRIGLLLVAGLLVASLTAGLLWRLTPAAVRQVVRRTDDLTGARRGPDWRRVAVAGTVAGLALAVPIHVPTAETCGGRLQSPCAQPASRPVFDLPPVKIPPIKLPTIAVPTFSPIPNRISNPFPVPEMSVRP